MTQLTVDLPDDVAASLALMAASRGRNTLQLAADLIRSSVAENTVEKELQSLQGLSDEDVIAMADLRLTPDEDARLHELLELNGEDALSDQQRSELDDLMHVYDDAVLRKSMGLAEAVRRKLRAPLSP